jgi:uncharacterized protein (UPF0262 family)
MSGAANAAQSPARLIEITLENGSGGRSNVNIEHEREVAIYDLLDGNSFEVDGHSGPYKLALGIADDRLTFKIASEAGEPLVTHAIPLQLLKRILKDYFLVLDSYYQAVRTAQPSRIEAIDVGRRGLHDEGSQLVVDKLAGKVAMDFETARRLFTLIATLHWKG